jgi:hypothetical protein
VGTACQLPTCPAAAGRQTAPFWIDSGKDDDNRITVEKTPAENLHDRLNSCALDKMFLIFLLNNVDVLFSNHLRKTIRLVLIIFNQTAALFMTNKVCDTSQLNLIFSCLAHTHILLNIFFFKKSHIGLRYTFSFS